MANDKPKSDFYGEGSKPGPSKATCAPAENSLDEDYSKFKDELFNVYFKYTVTSITDSVKSGATANAEIGQRKKDMVAELSDYLIDVCLDQHEKQIEEKVNELRAKAKIAKAKKLRLKKKLLKKKKAKLAASN